MASKARRSIARVALVAAMTLGLLIGSGSAAGAGEWCIRIGFPTPVPDVRACIPT